MADNANLFVASGRRTVIRPRKITYLRPLEGSDDSAYVALVVKSDYLVFSFFPYHPSYQDYHIANGYPGYDLHEVHAKLDEDDIACTPDLHKLPMFLIEKIDLETREVTLLLDQDVEEYEPQILPPHPEATY